MFRLLKQLVFFFNTLLTNPQMKVGISFVLVCKCSMNNKKAG